MIDRQRQLHALHLGVLDDLQRRRQLVVLDQRLAHRQPEGLEEGVGHGPADQQVIDAAEEVLDHLELVRHLGAAQDGDERPLGVAERLAQPGQLLLHQQAGAGGGEGPDHGGHRGVGAVRGAERVVRRRRRPAWPARWRSSARSPPPRRWKRRFSSSTTREPPGASDLAIAARAGSPMQSLANTTSQPSSCDKCVGHRLQAVLRRHLALRAVPGARPGSPWTRGRARSGCWAAPR